MGEFSKYLLKFSKNADKVQTHLSFNKGKYNVPDENFDEFYSEYFKAVKSKEELYLIEKVYNSTFAFFLDLEVPKAADRTNELSDGDVKHIITSCIEVINDMFQVDSNKIENELSYVVSKRESKFHVNFYNVIVDSTIAKKVCTELFQKLEDSTAQCIDVSVYRTGLRLLGSKKVLKDKQDTVYNVYDLEQGVFVSVDDLSYEAFKKTTVRRKEGTPMSTLQDAYKGLVKVGKAAIPVKGVDNNGIADEVARLLQVLQVTNEWMKDLNLNVERIYAAQNKAGMFCYYVSIGEKYCPFKQREHQRPSSPIYIEIGMNGIFMKCYDQECLRRKYPEEGIKLPADFETNYSKLYLSMTTKYWTSEVKLTEETKKFLEDSLNGSHYQVAKTTFNILKDRFRVDDVRNTTWYEYDGVRWKKSHLMNILISEELPKYYKGIKISDTSVAQSNLQEYLVNNEKMDSNLRNQLVDSIINKLENVTFKNNVLNQVTYLYKTYDPDFYQNLDSNPYLVGFKNGVYDFTSNSFRQGQQSDYITFSTGYEYIEYDENDENVREIYEFLSKIIPNKRVREYMLKVLGKALKGIPDEKFYIWTGLSGANGKSTLVNFLEQTLGDYTTSVDVSLLTNKRGNSSNASPDIVRLRGKRLFTFQEPEHDDKLRTGILKQYTGGDTIIARELFKAPIQFKLQGTMIMCCNDLPAVSSIDGGTWRRIRVIEFKSRFCDHPVKTNEFKIDPFIKHKIQKWRPYFMSILIHWYNMFLLEGLQEPDEVKTATANYKDDNDKFNEFFDHCLEDHSNHFVSNKTIYQDCFMGWWETNYPNTRTPEIKELRRAMKIKYGSEVDKVNSNGLREKGFAVAIKYEIAKSVENEEDDL